MEAVLLGFCLISLILSSAFVLIELTRDHKRQKCREPLVQKSKLFPNTRPLKETRPHDSSPERIPLQQKGKGLDALNHQLVALGYVSSAQKLGFVNRVLKSQRTQMEDIDPNEIRHLFKMIRRYTRPSVPLETTAQPATPQTAAHI